MKINEIVILMVGVLGAFFVTQAEPTKVKPQQTQGFIGNTIIRVTALEIMGTQNLSRISSHFSDTQIVDKVGFMYAGTDTAGIPITKESRTIFWLFSEKVPSNTVFQPDRATLRTQAGQVIGCITNDTIYMSCPGWVFPRWREEHGTITGFIVFPLVPNLNGKLRLPYVDQGKVGELIFRFEREK